MTLLQNGKQTKQPWEVDVFIDDLTPWLADSDTITGTPVVTYVCKEDAADVALVIGAITVDGTGKIISIWLSGGTDGRSYRITIRSTTTQGRKAEDEFVLKVKDAQP